jgi:hypothetical protein
MKKKTLQLIAVTALLFTAIGTKAQLANGSIAKDFTLLDINGKSYTLYSFLDAGKTVVIDMSATWCGPCWNYHKTGALEKIWAEHGPKGQAGVNATTTDDMMVLFIEADKKTTLAELKGSGSSQGDWVTGTPYPIFNPEGTVCTQVVSTDYKLKYFPTCYLICPDRKVTLVDQWTAAKLYTQQGKCPKSTGIDEQTDAGSVSVYPNPLISDATISYTLKDMSSVSISVMNALGQRVLNQDLGKLSAGQQTYSLDASTLKNGLYFLNLTIGSNTITKKIAVNR